MNDMQVPGPNGQVCEFEITRPTDDCTVLQPLFLPADASIDALYLRYLTGYAEVSDRVLQLQKKAKISFNSYFNSFYESYWQALTGLVKLNLEIECAGSLFVEVFRDTKDYGCHRIAFCRIDAEAPTVRRLALPALGSGVGAGGRIFVDITARKQSSVRDIRFVTDGEPTCQPHLSVGICTFNRESFLLRNLRALLEEEGLADSLAKIVVVNQGPSFSTPELAELVSGSDRVLLIEQGNLGGCGGFTRTMHEALELEGVTHHVLMDDDAVIDARVLRNLVSLLSFTGDSKVIGGHMLDLLRPHFLYEAGAVVKSNTRLKSLHHNIDLRAVDALIPFNKYQEVDYNAWWFCAIPTEQIRKAQLPAPIFIRGDDMEYGIRLKELGVKTVAMPGIAVWQTRKEPAEHLNMVQDVFFSSPKDVLELYRRDLLGRVEFDVYERCLNFEENSKTSFNTYFNSFYESYWAEFAQVEDLCLQIDFSGDLCIEVYRDSKGFGCSKIIEQVVSSSGSRLKKIIDLVEPEDNPVPGRLFVDVTSRAKSCVYGIQFYTASQKKNDPRISVGICTFNREKFLLRNLRALLEEEGLAESLAKIVVVNQGPSFSTPELAELVSGSDRVLLIEQGNLGGCGGFTRSMYEALQLEGVTNHVLMDDDAVIDARVLRNLVSLLSFTGDSKVIGGHMLDLLRPHFLYEAGAVVKSNTRLKSLHHNIDLRAVDALIPFNKYQEVDYNAWWFCAIPTEQIRKAQLPAPIFIRGDDMEYGIRLQELGVKTVAMPGIAVWHEPFYVKVGGWQVYYDLRNRLIMASTYPNRFKHEAPIDVLWWMLKAAASHDYLTCELLVRATHDFLSGPDLFARSADEIHAEIGAMAKALAQPSVPESELPAPPAKLRRMPKSDFGLALLVVWRIGQNLLAGKPGGAKLLVDHEANLSNIGPHAYVKTNGMSSYCLLYAPDRERLFGTVRKAFVAWWAYIRNRDKAAKAWAERVPELRTPLFWQSVFDTDAAKRQVVGEKPVVR